MCLICERSDIIIEANDCLFSTPGSTIARVVTENTVSSDTVFTSNTMEVGDTFQGTLDSLSDEDWIAIELTQGQTVRIEHDGTGFDALSDPLLQLRNQNGSLITVNDDGGPGFNSLIEYTVDATGTYFIVADAYSTQQGDYTVSVTQFTPVYDEDTLLGAIDWGSTLDDNTVNVYFTPAGFVLGDPDFDVIVSEAWNSYERGQFQLAFDIIETFTDLNFNIVTNPVDADFILMMDTDQIGGDALGFFYPPGEGPNAGIGVFAGDQWDRSAGGDLEQGGTGFVTITHELLHGLGLAHPHDRGGASGILPGVNGPFDDYGSFGLNQGIYTTMSYNSGWNTGTVGARGDWNGDWGFEGGPMAIDIAMLQALYGANTDYNGGDDTYTLTDANSEGTMWMSIWDTGGIDTIEFSGTRDAQIDLRTATLEIEAGGGGFLSGANGVAGGFTIAHGVVIERAVSGSGDDTLRGNTANNRLTGNAGDDQAWGSAGDDLIFGGAGNDFLRGGNDVDTLHGGADADILSGQRHGDTIYGGDGNDRVFGGGGNDRLFGDDGNDFIKGGTRRDVLHGGAGDDIISGNSFDDELYGGAGNDLLRGGGDNDILQGGRGGDTLKGGTGNDTFVFNTGDGSDRILDFGDGDDTLQLSRALADGRSAQDIVNGATDLGGGRYTLDFGNGDTILLSGAFDISALANHIDIA